MRNEISISLALLSAAATILLLASSVLPLSNPLLQPVQAQTTSLSFRTTNPASGMSLTQQADTLTFDAQGTIAAASSNSQSPNVANITNGTIQLHYNNNTSYSGTIKNGTFTNTTSGGDISFTAQVENQNQSYLVTTPCTASDSNSIILTNGDLDQYFLGAVECSPSSLGGGNTTSSSMTGTTTQDGDGDGIADS